VNRWPDGYEHNPLLTRIGQRPRGPNIVGRKKFGRIAIAHSDPGATAYTDMAIDQAYRAVQELVTAKKALAEEITISSEVLT
jgi:spermidine dehydrogenase